jgi:2-polyprenyl-3-methyl-5-hydroxy-6-metoxy-1,4-benzoquinol methylase
MELIEYDGWVNLTKKYLTLSSKILDLACGSGTLAISLANDGYKVSGLDLSKEIIAVAREKMITNHVEIDFAVKDMTNFNYEEKFDVITCYFDSVNFLTKDEVSKMMDSVYNNLKDGGYFIFDLFTLSKMKEFNNLTIKDNLAFAKYKWKMNVRNNIIYHKIKISDGSTKIIEKYHEYYHDVNEIIDHRFKIISITTDFKDSFSEDDERILVVLQK